MTHFVTLNALARRADRPAATVARKLKAAEIAADAMAGREILFAADRVAALVRILNPTRNLEVLA